LNVPLMADANAARPRVVLMPLFGLPGAGKSTLAAAIATHAAGEQHRLVVVEFDDIYNNFAGDTFDPAAWHTAFTDFTGAVEQQLAAVVAPPAISGGTAAGLTVVVPIDNLYYGSMRAGFLHAAQRSNAGNVVGVVAFGTALADCAPAVCLERNAARSEASRVPNIVIENMAARLECGVAKGQVPASHISLSTETLSPSGFAAAFWRHVENIAQCEFCPNPPPLRSGPVPETARHRLDAVVRAEAHQLMAAVAATSRAAGDRALLATAGARLSAVKAAVLRRCKEQERAAPARPVNVDVMLAAAAVEMQRVLRSLDLYCVRVGSSSSCATSVCL
jgi:hypothetical protein